MPYDKTKLTQRLSRIAGQVNGISRMIEHERYCIDILHQMAAIKAALSRVEDAILSDHANHCIAEAIASGSEDEQRRKFNELIELMSKVKK